MGWVTPTYLWVSLMQTGCVIQVALRLQPGGRAHWTWAGQGPQQQEIT